MTDPGLFSANSLKSLFNHYLKAASTSDLFNLVKRTPYTCFVSEISSDPENGWHHPQFSVVYINGIMTTPEECHETARFISSNLDGMYVKAVYNSSEGFLDIIDLVQEKVGKITTPVDLLIKTLQNELNTGKKVNLIAHSEGAAITECALKNSTFNLNMLSIDALGGASILPNYSANHVIGFLK